jgi:hypothetical protein
MQRVMQGEPAVFARPNAPTNTFRRARFQRFLTVIDTVLARRRVCRIVDLGGTPDYWKVFEDELRDRPVEVLIVNNVPQEQVRSRFDCIVADATDLGEFPDDSFDVVHSNSVIEHVGSWRNMVGMAREVRRLAPAYYVQTPNFWFPYEPHARTPFFHWLPVPARISLLMRKRCGFYEKAETVNDAMRSIEDARCLTRMEMQALFPDADVTGERVMGLTKSWMAIRTAR